eukprot:Sdes_comp18727_c0_seq3m9064
MEVDEEFIEQEDIEDDSQTELNLNNIDRNLWLVKIPAYLSKEWATCGPNMHLGKVRVENVEGSTEPKVSINLTESIGKFPKNYSLSFSSTESLKGSSSNNVLAVFSENPVNSQMAMEGKVVRRCDLTPEFSAEYQKLNRERMIKYDKPVRTTGLVQPIQQNYKPVPNKRDAEKRKKEMDKRERMEQEALENILFELFEKQESYSLRDLLKLTNQPVVR